MTRTFVHTPAVRSRVPLLVGLTGPSGSGKTKSALRLADGMRSVDGGEVFVVDTESNRALHYADEHRFQHVPFNAPFAPADYLTCFRYCVDNGATIIIADSTSHEWEGEGGVLDIQARVERGDPKRKMIGWAAAKKEHGLFVRTMLQIPCHFILCFRAKTKLDVKKGKDPEALGFMPIGGTDLVYELALNALLLPGARGVPTWAPEEKGEREIVKRPGWADRLLKDGRPLDEETGAKLAQWAAGTVVRSTAELLDAYNACSDPATLGVLERERRAMWRSASSEEKLVLKAAVEAASERVKAAGESPSEEPPEELATGSDG